MLTCQPYFTLQHNDKTIVKIINFKVMLNCSEDRAMSPEYLQAFNGGVNLVWNADFTFAWKLREVVQFDSINGGYRPSSSTQVVWRSLVFLTPLLRVLTSWQHSAVTEPQFLRKELHW